MDGDFFCPDGPVIIVLSSDIGKRNKKNLFWL